ncbi:MAG: hypothetical protein SO007_06090 [Candidatus Enteromonas sp.]|nr:hypothetical protein [Candidatus Enteromonas sp.]
MTNDSKLLLAHIKDKIGIRNPGKISYYRSLPICILDDIFSLRAKYETNTLPTVKRYANHFLNGNIYFDGYLINNFIEDLNKEGLPKVMNNILKNRQVVGRKKKIEVCYDIAKKLQELGIQTIKEFASFNNKDYLTLSLRSVKGVGDAAINYLFMMTGDSNRVKPDIHIHHCIKDAIGHDVSNEDCQKLFKEVSKAAKDEYPFVTPRLLDSLVWAHYSKAKFD